MTPEFIRWTSFPMLESSGKGILGLSFLIGLPVLLWIQEPQQWFFPAFAVVFFLFTLSSFFFPTTYELDRSGITIKRLLFRNRRGMKWLKRWVVGKDAIFLSPYARRHWREQFEGILLLFPAKHKDMIPAVVKFLEKHHPGNRIQS